MKEISQNLYRWIMLTIILLIITSVGTAYATYKYLYPAGIVKTDEGDKSFESLEYTLSRFRSQLEKEYIGEINDEELIDGAIKGYVAALGDPYTVYYTKKEMEDIMTETEGSYVGIGIYMTMNSENNTIEVVKPIEDSPAEKAGIMAGDVITKVDGESFTGEKMEEASNKIKGDEGTKVKLEIKRNNEIKTFEITRKKILISHITSKVLENNIGYIAIEDFDGGCADEFKTKYQKLEKQNIQSLIIDIRNNGGGIVDEALDILDMIIDKDKTLLITKDKQENEEITKAKENPIIKMPIVVLTNEYSASASEILAGALQDNEKATLVGTKTYGKGIIQSLHQLSDGSGLKITSSEYYTPSGKTIHKIGIEPDVEVKLPDELKYASEIDEKDDTQLQKAIEVLKK